MSESPSLLLQRAADKLTEMADLASPPRWAPIDLTDAGHPGVWWVKADYEDEESYGSHCVAELETVNPKADAAWIATMSPAVATPLVAWLRAIAANMAQAGIGEDWARAVFPPEARAALDFARLVLGLSVEEETTHE